MMKSLAKKFIQILFISLIAGAVLTGCGGGGGGSTSSSGGGTGSLSLSLTDAPVDEADEVVITFTGLEIQPDDGERIVITFDTPKTWDLLALNSGLSEELLSSYILDVGRYNWIRLFVDESASYITINGAQFDLRIPSNANNGLKLNRGFTVTDGGDVDFTIDFDLRKSVHNPVGQSNVYILRPTLRIVDNHEVGTIAGSVSEVLLLTDLVCFDVDDGSVNAAVYAYKGEVSEPDDIDEDDSDGQDPEVTTMVKADGEGYSYTLAFLEPGNYTVALTCEADQDDADEDDDINFLQSVTSITVLRAETTVVDFDIIL